jgi:hypothetical protein
VLWSFGLRNIFQHNTTLPLNAKVANPQMGTSLELRYPDAPNLRASKDFSIQHHNSSKRRIGELLWRSPTPELRASEDLTTKHSTSSERRSGEPLKGSRINSPRPPLRSMTNRSFGTLSFRSSCDSNAQYP